MVMTDEEFDLLDELYFVKYFDELLIVLAWDEEKLKNALYSLLEKKWIKVFINQDEIEVTNQDEFLSGYADYQYIATKNGLLAHNRN